MLKHLVLGPEAIALGKQPQEEEVDGETYFFRGDASKIWVLDACTPAVSPRISQERCSKRLRGPEG